LSQIRYLQRVLLDLHGEGWGRRVPERGEFRENDTIRVRLLPAMRVDRFAKFLQAWIQR